MPVAALVAVGCAFFVGPVPCVDDTSCPYAQRCVDVVCTTAGGAGDGEGEGEGEDIGVHDRFGELEPNGRPVERCLGLMIEDLELRFDGSELGRNLRGDVADINCGQPVIACDVPADQAALPASCEVERDAAVCFAPVDPASPDEGPRERCARVLGTSALLVSDERILPVLLAASRLTVPVEFVFVLIDGQDDDEDGAFVRRDGKIIAPGPVGAFEPGQPSGGQECLALDVEGFNDVTCTELRAVVCHDVRGVFARPECSRIGASAHLCPALSFDDAVAFCAAHDSLLAEVTNPALFEAIRRAVAAPAWVGARRVAVGGGEGGFAWLGGLPLRVR